MCFEIPSQKRFNFLLNSLLGSHLLGLKSTIDHYMPLSSITIQSRVSFDTEELDQYYTQDSKLEAIMERSYIIDYIKPISILIKLGVQPDTNDWGFAENLKKYINGTLNLDNPSLFLLDGFLYGKGLEKQEQNSNFLQIITKLNETTNTQGFFNGGVLNAMSLTTQEKENAIKEFDKLYQAHHERVATYIKNLTLQNKSNIKKSREFLNSIFIKNVPSKEFEIEFQEEIEEPNSYKIKTKRNHYKKHNKNRKHTFQQAIPKTNEPQALIVDTSSLENIVPEIITIEPTEKNVLTGKEEMIETTIFVDPIPSVQTQLFTNKEEKKTSTNIVNHKKSSILSNLLDTTTSPFTILYSKALNAMSDIDIVEVQSKRKGDYRKFIRYDTNGKIIGKIFAYKPATPTLGHELMKIYRTFIQQQLKDRVDIQLN
ncbi:MAG: hypothetical protein ACRYGR_06960 [Janthinobacterium lividum]